MNKIADILRYAPVGLKLYSPMVGDVDFLCVKDDVGKRDVVEVISHAGKDTQYIFDMYGRYRQEGDCLLFPNKTIKTWEGWQCYLFNCGDFITNIDGYRETLVISGDDINMAYNSNNAEIYCFDETMYRWATPNEVCGFMAELDRHGYYWDSESKEIKQKLTPPYDEKAVSDMLATHKIKNILNLLPKLKNENGIDVKNCEILENILKASNSTEVENLCKNFTDNESGPTFQVGDSVIVKYRTMDENDYSCGYLDDMLDYVGKTFTIKKVIQNSDEEYFEGDDGYTYYLSGITWAWSRPMLERDTH